MDTLLPQQAFLIDHVKRHKLTHILKKRRVGVTSALLHFVAQYILDNKDKTVVVALPTWDNAVLARRILQSFNEGIIFECQAAKSSTHSRILFTGVNSSYSILGVTIDVLVLDEIGDTNISDLNNFWGNTVPALHNNAKIITTESLSSYQECFLREKLIFNSFIIL